MQSLLTRYEIDMAHQHQEQLRRKATLWHLARQHARSARGNRLARPGRLQLALMLVVLLLGAAASASQLIHA
jgi:hypothetical protein